MPVLPPSNTPSDMIFLLGEISGKMDSLTQAFGLTNSRLDNQEQRIVQLETNSANRAGYVGRFENVEKEVADMQKLLAESKGAAAVVKFIWSIVGAAVISAVLWVYNEMHQPDVKETTKIERSITASS